MDDKEKPHSTHAPSNRCSEVTVPRVKRRKTPLVSLLPLAVETQTSTLIASMSGVRRRKSVVESSDDDEDAISPRGTPGGAFPSSSATQHVAVAESRLRKVIVRSVVGFFMVTSFVGIVWAGHLYLSALVVLIQVGVRWCFATQLSRVSALKQSERIGVVLDCSGSTAAGWRLEYLHPEAHTRQGQAEECL